MRTPHMQNNVVRLPSAAPRKIVNPVRASRDYQLSQRAWPGLQKPMLPVQADARVICSYQSPALLIALHILKALPAEQRRSVVDSIRWTEFHADDETARLASLLAERIGGAA